MKLDLQAGIFQMEDKMPGLIVTNYWNQVIRGEWVSVLGGAAPRYTEDGREKLGPAGLWLWYQTEGQYDWHPAPGEPQGPLRIDAALGHVVQLVSRDGAVLHFDAVQRRYEGA